MAEPGLYERLGGIFAIAAVADNFSDRLLGNPKIVDANPELHEWHTVTYRTRMPGLKWGRTSWLAASGLPLLCHALRERAAMSLSFKPGEVETHDRETDIMQAVHGRATVVTGEDKYILAVSDVLVIPGGVPQPVRGRHQPFLFLSATRYRPRSP
jgi:mannose-6-phosphate isomerase-like protein (cupin superfamily)